MEHYTFNHALLRDAAYDSLLRAERRGLHLRVARALVAYDPQAVAQQPELLAMHLTEGNEPEEAAPHWLEAARRSLSRSALTEATRLLRHGLDALERLPASPSVLNHRLALSALLGPALIALKGPASSEAQELYRERLCVERTPSRAPIPVPAVLGLVAGIAGVRREKAARRNAAGACRGAWRPGTAAAGAPLQLGDPLRRRRFCPLLRVISRPA